MYKLILVLLAIGALIAVAVWFTSEGVVRHLLQFAFAMDVMVLIFAASIGFLQWVAPTNPDGTPRT